MISVSQVHLTSLNIWKGGSAVCPSPSRSEGRERQSQRWGPAAKGHINYSVPKHIFVGEWFLLKRIQWRNIVATPGGQSWGRVIKEEKKQKLG